LHDEITIMLKIYCKKLGTSAFGVAYMSFSIGLKGVVVNYRIGPREQYPRECIIQIQGISSRSEAGQLIGKRVYWTDGKNDTIVGVIVASHGNKGLVRARFRRGLPGQALGTEVKIIG